MQNLWNALCNSSVFEYLHLVGVNERYIYGNASDFEKLCVLFRSLKYADGNCFASEIAAKASALVAKKMSVADIAEVDALNLWTEYNKNKYGVAPCDKKCSAAPCSVSNIYCDEKYCKEPKAVDLERLLDGSEKSLPNTQAFCLYAEFFGSEFNRPNAYSADAEAQKRQRGERFDRDIIFCQMIFDAVYQDKFRTVQVMVHSHGGEKYASEFVKYVLLRKIGMRISVVADGTLSPLQIKNICLLGNNDCFVTPTINKKLWKSDLPIDDYINELSRIYPRGRIDYFEFKMT